ncbi:twin-arginine translocase subunit TatC [Crocinitomix catalasitica]|uniref:twin-arginine translocase subunit TatC n=1 Tax=Crocinitomix catalasitica TaxID=184607 RepID=UPI000489278D|nr:twin-arginine translocase subunit TatC [Crocinitomix catalasitica]
MSEENTNMPFLSHLEELRWRLVKSIIAVVVFAIAIFYFTSWITNNIFLALAEPEFPIFRFFCWGFNICSGRIDIDFQSVEMSGQFSTNLMMAIIGGLIVAFPIVFHQIWGFIKPGLRQSEVKSVRGIVFFVSLLFFIGIAFGYFVVAPLSVQFLGNWKMVDQIENNITINSYLKTIISTVFFTGLLFLLPVIILIFSKIGIISAKFLKKFRKHALVAILIVSAIITPPDLFTQVIVSLPIIVLYEIGIIIAKRIEKKRYKASLKK